MELSILVQAARAPLPLCHLQRLPSSLFLRVAIVFATLLAALQVDAELPAGNVSVRGIADDAVAREYSEPVRPIGVNGQAAWNVRSIWFMYPPTFGFAGHPAAKGYRFAVVDELGRTNVFTAASANASLAPVWAKVAGGWATGRCEAVDDRGGAIAAVGERTFWKQAPYRPGAYPAPDRSPLEVARSIGRYVMKLPIVERLYLSGKPVPKEMVNPENQVFVAYPSKMGAAIIEAMAALAKSDPSVRAEALRLAEGARRHLEAVTEPDGAALAGFPQTYEAHPGLTKHPAKMIAANGGKVMMIYPCSVAGAYLSLYEVTKDAALRDAAVKIADKYLQLQGEDGTWPLNCWRATGKPVERNRLVPVHLMQFLERMFALTGERKYRTAADRAFAAVEQGPLTTWNWEGQFEDVKPSERYRNLTKHDACATAMYLLKRFPGDARRLAQARELLRFAEDQFVCWERPLHGRSDGTRATGGFDLWDCASWRCPAVLEQYSCYVPIDSSAAKLINTYLALYAAEGKALDLAKARTLGASIIRETKADGYCPTFWFNFREDWPNCMLASAVALERLAGR